MRKNSIGVIMAGASALAASNITGFSVPEDHGTHPRRRKEYGRVIHSGGQMRRAPGQGHSPAEREARRRAQNAEYRDRKAWRAWLATLTAEELAFARKHKLTRPIAEDRPAFGSAQSEDALDHAEAEPIPEALILGHRQGHGTARPIVSEKSPILDELEPQTLSVDLENLSAHQIRQASETFEQALRWALAPATPSKSAAATDLSNPPPAAHPLVALGERSATLIVTMRLDLAGSLQLEPALAKSLLQSFGLGCLRETVQRLQATGAIYARLLEWMRRTSTLDGLGERLQLVAYQLRPDLIDAATLAQLGEATGKTRQALNKPANCLRDTFDGLKALIMRADVTRLLCRQAQLSAA
jgi:hypothetical protein